MVEVTCCFVSALGDTIRMLMRWATPLLLTLALGYLSIPAKGDMGPTTPADSEVQNVDFVGCPVLGHIDDVAQAAPVKQSIRLRLRKGASNRVAVYQGSSGPAVIGPKGWHCFVRYGSAAWVLDVRPNAFTSSGGFGGGVGASSAGAISVVIHDGETSGRYGAAAVIARLFPEYRSFAEGVRDSGEVDSRQFVFEPFPADRVSMLAHNVAQFETPAGTDGMGTLDGLEKGVDPIEGVALVKDSAGKLTVRVVRARLGKEYADVHAVLMEFLANSALGRIDVLGAISESPEVDWSALPGEWSSGACDRQRTVVSLDGSWIELERVTGEAWDKRGPYVYEVLPFETKICVGERGTDNISCSVVSRLDRVHFESKSVLDPDGTGEIVEEKSRRCDQVQGLESDQPQAPVEIESVDDRTYLLQQLNKVGASPVTRIGLLLVLLLMFAHLVRAPLSLSNRVVFIALVVLLGTTLSYFQFARVRSVVHDVSSKVAHLLENGASFGVAQDRDSQSAVGSDALDGVATAYDVERCVETSIGTPINLRARMLAEGECATKLASSVAADGLFEVAFSRCCWGGNPELDPTLFPSVSITAVDENVRWVSASVNLAITYPGGNRYVLISKDVINSDARYSDTVSLYSSVGGRASSRDLSNYNPPELQEHYKYAQTQFKSLLGFRSWPRDQEDVRKRVRETQCGRSVQGQPCWTLYVTTARVLKIADWRQIGREFGAGRRTTIADLERCFASFAKTYLATRYGGDGQRWIRFKCAAAISQRIETSVVDFSTRSIGVLSSFESESGRLKSLETKDGVIELLNPRFMVTSFKVELRVFDSEGTGSIACEWSSKPGLWMPGPIAFRFGDWCTSVDDRHWQFFERAGNISARYPGSAYPELYVGRSRAKRPAAMRCVNASEVKDCWDLQVSSVQGLYSNER